MKVASVRTGSLQSFTRVFSNSFQIRFFRAYKPAPNCDLCEKSASGIFCNCMSPIVQLSNRNRTRTGSEKGSVVTIRSETGTEALPATGKGVA